MPSAAPPPRSGPGKRALCRSARPIARCPIPPGRQPKAATGRCELSPRPSDPCLGGSRGAKLRLLPMKDEEIARLRLHRQHLTGTPLATPEAVVGWLGAVQAQEFGVAKWSIAQRSRGRVTSADLDRALAEGRLLRGAIPSRARPRRSQCAQQRKAQRAPLGAERDSVGRAAVNGRALVGPHHWVHTPTNRFQTRHLRRRCRLFR